MARYIDVEPIILDTKAMKSICEAIEIDGIIKRLEEAPTADVKEVVRGKWKVSLKGTTDYNTKIFCSVCKTHNVFESKFCPNCGADMRNENG